MNTRPKSGALLALAILTAMIGWFWFDVPQAVDLCAHAPAPCR